MAIARLRLGTFGKLRTQLVVALTLALAAVAIPYPDAAVKANGATGTIISTTTLTSDINPSVTGQTVTFTATVAGPITSYAGPGIDGPTGIAVGPDGALWFGNYGNNSIGRITTNGVVTNYTDAGISRPYTIAAGPPADGTLWFTSRDNSKIGRITTAGAINLYSDATKIAGPYGIALGSDDALWYANGGIGGQYITKRSIGRITTAGAVSYYPAPGGDPWSCSTPGPVCEPTGIAAGPDGALWFTNSGTNSIGRITTGGTLSEYTGTGVSTPLHITAGPDGALWFTNAGNNSIGRITTGATPTITNYTSGTISGPRFITTGSDGALWFTNAIGDSIGRITTAGVVTAYTAASVDGPNGIVSGPDGAIWFTNFDGDSIGRIDTAAPAGGTPTGSVQFSIDGVNVGAPVALNAAGRAQLAVSTLTHFFHEVAATYSGDSNFLPSSSTDHSQSVCLTAVLGAGGTLTTSPEATPEFPFALSLTTPNAGTVTICLQPVVGAAPSGFSYLGYELVITASAATAANPLVLVFQIDASLLAGQNVADIVVNRNGVVIADCTAADATPDPCVASRVLLPSGDAQITGRTSSVSTWTFATPNTSTAVTSNNNPSVFGQPVTFTATVSEAVSGSPTGTVAFKAGGTTITGCGAAALNASAQATCGPLTDLAVGDHTISAVYSGDGNFAASTSPNLTQTVNNRAATGTAVTSNQNPSVFGQPVTFTATVSEAASGSPTGTVAFRDGGTTINGCAAAPLNGSGQATCGPLSDLSVGDHSITAVYSGDSNFAGATSPAVKQTVTPASTADTTLPVTSNVSAVLRAGGQVSSGPLLLSWSASDNATPAGDLVHQIQIRRLKHGTWRPWTSVATVTGNQLEIARPLWRHFQYRIQTRDQAGNWGAWAESAPIVLLRRDDRHFRKSIGWTTLPMAGAMRSDVAQSSTVGSWARLRFWGSGVALVMPTGTGLGSIEVCLDASTSAKQCQTVDLSTFTPSGARRLVAVFNGLAYGLHHLRVRVTGGTVDLDGALISL